MMKKIDLRLNPGASPGRERRLAALVSTLAVLAFLLMALPLSAQSLRVTGQVTDTNGQPLPGVTVAIPGTTQGQLTDANGNYQINVPTNGVLQFSLIGFTSSEQAVGSRTRVDVVLMEELKTLDEVVAVGYATMRKIDLTGTVASVQGGELANIPVTTAAEAITGKLAGVQVITTSGAPDADIRIRVRGGGSITQDNSPLYIVDGFPVDNALTLIAPTDIERIDVLKDASSTAIYGARGANGVVIITTKAGKKGQTVVNFDAYVGTRQIVREVEMMTPYDYVVSAWERTRIDSNDLQSTQMQSFIRRYGEFSTFQSRYGNDPGRNWQDEMFRSALTQNYNFSINGGNESTSYNIGLLRNIDEGALLGSTYNRTIITGKFQHQANERLSFGFSTRYNHNTTYGGGVSTRNSAMYRPTEGLNGNLELDEFDDDYLATYDLINPVLLSAEQYSRRKIDNFNVMGELSYRLGDFVFKTQAGIDNNQSESRSFNGPHTKSAIQYGGPTASVTETKVQKWINSNTLSWNKTIAADHNVSAMIGQEWSDMQRRAVTLSVRQFPAYMTPDKAFGMLSVGAAEKPTSVDSSYQLFSFFGRVSYDYRGKYLFNASLRADGSSNFMPQNRWGYFPSVGAAWRISEEDFMTSLSKIDNLKLRYSFGVAGNDRITSLLWTTQWITDATTQYGIDNIKSAAYKPNLLASPNIKWETTIASNIGLDLSMFRSRLNVTVDYYNNRVKDLLLDSPLPAHVGFGTQMINIGETRNRGVEFVVDGTIIRKQDFTWSAGFNISFNRSKVIALNGLSDTIYQDSGFSTAGPKGEFLVEVGKPLGQLYGYVYDGWYSTDDFVNGSYNASTKYWELKTGIAEESAYRARPGDVKFKNLSTEGESVPTITVADRTVIGNTAPKHFGGFNMAFAYKGIDLRADFNWSYGNDIYNATKLSLYDGRSRETNMPVEMAGRFTYLGTDGEPIADLTALNQRNAGATMYAPYRGTYVLHSGLVEDGSFLRLNNLTLGYTLPKRWVEKAGIKNMRIYLTATNVFCLTDYSGYDPEVDAYRSNPLTFGVDNWGYPKNRSFIGGINLSF